MSDILALNKAIGEAYGLCHVSHDMPAAVDHLRQAINDMRPLAEQRRDELAAVVKARTVGARCGCTITKTTHDLLALALGS